MPIFCDGNWLRKENWYVILQASSQEDVHCPQGSHRLVPISHDSLGFYQRYTRAWRGSHKRALLYDCSVFGCAPWQVQYLRFCILYVSASNRMPSSRGERTFCKIGSNSSWWEYIGGTFCLLGKIPRIHLSINGVKISRSTVRFSLVLNHVRAWGSTCEGVWRWNFFCNLIASWQSSVVGIW